VLLTSVIEFDTLCALLPKTKLGGRHRPLTIK
jgi:hypothetical protein